MLGSCLCLEGLRFSLGKYFTLYWPWSIQSKNTPSYPVLKESWADYQAERKPVLGWCIPRPFFLDQPSRTEHTICVIRDSEVKLRPKTSTLASSTGPRRVTEPGQKIAVAEFFAHLLSHRFGGCGARFPPEGEPKLSARPHIRICEGNSRMAALLDHPRKSFSGLLPVNAKSFHILTPVFPHRLPARRL